MLNAVLARAQRACCTAVDGMVPTLAGVAAFEQRIASVLIGAWRATFWGALALAITAGVGALFGAVA